MSIIGFCLVLGALSYSALLCFLNTRVMPISNGMVALADGGITLAALAAAFKSQFRPMRVLLLAIAVNFLIQSLLASSLDIKAVRDPLVVIGFLFLGLSVGQFAPAQRIFTVAACAVLALGAWEFLALENFVSMFNARNFYLARGVIEANAPGAETGLFVSGIRGFGRTLLPFLGAHRVSSLFLEPVSMGNFGAIAAAWALAQDGRRVRTMIFAGLVAAIVIVLADARFALIAVGFFIAARFIPPKWTTLAVLVMPLVVLSFVLYFGAANPNAAGDDLPSRLALSGQAITQLSLSDVLGLGDKSYVTSDSGYYYVLKAFGLGLCLALWLAFAALRTPTTRAARFKLFMAIYICLLLCVSSTSLFALKTAALAWFMLGCLAGERGDQEAAPSSA